MPPLRLALLSSLATLLALPLPAQPIDVPGTDVGLPFSPGVDAGELVYLSGALGNEPGTLNLRDGAEAQAAQTTANLRAVLDAADLPPSRVASVTAFVADLRHRDIVEATLRDALPGAPAFALVEADVALPGALLEVAYTAARAEVVAVTPEGWPTAGPGQSWATRAGDTLVLSAVTATSNGGERPASVADETEAALRNVGAVLAAAGMTHRNLVQCRVVLPDARHFGEMNEGWRRVLAEEPPARETVRARLPDPDARVAVHCVASAGEKTIVAPEGTDLAALPFSPGLLADGTLYTAGMVGRGPDGYPSDVGEQTRITLERLRAVLTAAGLGPADVVEATVYLADIRDYATMNEVYRAFFEGAPPARATVGTQLMSSEARVEISFRARKR